MSSLPSGLTLMSLTVPIPAVTIESTSSGVVELHAPGVRVARASRPEAVDKPVGQAPGEIPRHVERHYALVVIGGVENLRAFIHPEVVRAGAVHVKRRHFSRMGEVGDIEDMDVARGGRAQGAGSLLPHEQVLFLAGVRVPEPPGV